ncbi:MAG: DUF1634 domain-containing protein [Candidatus Bathyarchaeia archaeon]
MGEPELRRMEITLSRILRGGVILSATLIALGLALMAATGDTSCPYGVPEIRWVLFGAPFLAPSHMLFLGFFVLISTPFLRIVASTLMFIRARDAAFALITSAVMLILLISFTLGIE